MLILVTGGTGFVGKALIRHLAEAGLPVRTLIRPSPRTPDLPRGVAFDVAVSTITDLRGLRAAMVGVDTVYHLVSGEWSGPRANLLSIDIQGTQAVVQAAKDAGVRRIFYVSHLGADRASAYPLLKAKAISEEFIRRSGLHYTIIRSAIVFGPHDGFSTGLAQLLQALPFVVLSPGDGNVLLQPLWIEDLVTCLTWALDDPDTQDRMVEIGGPEYLSFREIVTMISEVVSLRRLVVPARPPYLRALTVLLETLFPRLPVSVYWLDYLAANRTCALDTIPRVFDLMPSRMSPQRLGYLQQKDLRGSFFRTLLQRG